MNQDQVLETLIGLGLTRLDSQVYICLAKKGPQRGNEISKVLKIQKQQLYRSLKNLQSKGIVYATLEHPAQFSTVSFDKVIDLFIKAKMAEAQNIQDKKEEILENWQSLAVGESVESTAKFAVIAGRGYIYSKILQMVRETKNQLSSITTVPGLVRADQFGLFDAGFRNPPSSRPQFRFLTELSAQSIGIMKKLLSEMKRTKFEFEGRTPEIGLGLFPQMVIKDNAEAIFFITPPTELNEACLWTNCKSLVNAFLAVFEDLWRTAINVITKIEEFENGKTKPETSTINNSETAQRKYKEILESAEKEIVMINSLESLTGSIRNLDFLKGWTERNVLVRIMAPITTKNWAESQRISKEYEIRHIPKGYLNTTVIDGKHLFQFRNSQPVEHEETDPSSCFENMFYSDNCEYVDRAKKMLDSIWEKAPVHSQVTLENYLDPTEAYSSPCSKGLGFDPLKKKTIGVIFTEADQSSAELTEKAVITKMIDAQKQPTSSSNGIVRLYSCNGQAIVHPPNHLSLPDMLVYFVHTEKHSTYGTQDFMHIVVKRETPTGFAFVPSVFVYDNPSVSEYWKKYFAGVPTSSNLQLVKKDELQVQLHGNILFAGWTVPITLVPQLFTLPPGCIMLEGYGRLKTGKHVLNLASGYKMEDEYNGFNAFVTFLHPSSNYSGPGTDGFVAREVISTIYPPSQ